LVNETLISRFGSIFRSQPPETIHAVATAVAEQVDPSLYVARIVAARCPRIRTCPNSMTVSSCAARQVGWATTI
jgi:hypothetical protein